MSDMKCPFCQQKMSKTENNMFYCGTNNCSLRYIEMPKKAVEEFAESYQDRLTDCKRIGNLNEELIRTRKALDKAKNGLKELKDIIACPPDISYETCVSMYAGGVLQEITTLEQKE